MISLSNVWFATESCKRTRYLREYKKAPSMTENIYTKLSHALNITNIEQKFQIKQADCFPQYNYILDKICWIYERNFKI